MLILLQSFALILASEMGDKTQLLALVLALRFKKPWAVMLGILAATLLNHGLATLLGGYVASQFPERHVKLALSLLFLAFAAWILIPDKLDGKETEDAERKGTNAFLTTTLLFFLAEMGDKTQLATLALGAKFQSPWLVTLGTTLGMLAADGLAVAFGERLTRIVPLRTIRILSALSFAGFGLAIYFS